MARINIEDKWWTDPRRTLMITITGDPFKIDGIFLNLIKIAQENIKKGSFIPIEIFKHIPFADHFMSVGLCAKDNDGIRLDGTDKHLRWVEQNVKNGRRGGKKSAARPRDKRGRLMSKQSPSDVQATLGESPSDDPSSHQTSISISISDSISDSSSSSFKEKKGEPQGASRRPKGTSGTQSLGSRIFDVYAQEYLKRYKTEPVRNTSVNSMAANIGKKLGEEGIEVAKFYVWHNKGFYVEKCHDIRFLLSDAASLRTQWATGKQVTRREAQDSENKQQVMNVWSKHINPEEGSNGKP